MRTDRNCNIEDEKEKRWESSTSRGNNSLGLERLNQNQKVLGSNGLRVSFVTFGCYNKLTTNQVF